MSYQILWKRLFDLVAASLLLCLLAPLFIICALGIRLSSPGPILFYQNRIGLNGATFRIFKLRTLHVDPFRQFKQTCNCDSEIFPFGGLLRRYKIDELPQLVNVLRGDMSFIGPRPFVPQVYDLMPDWAKKRVVIRPGLTGFAQVNGNAALSWEERWEYDLIYVERIGFLFDLSLLFKTIFVIFIGESHFAPKS